MIIFRIWLEIFWLLWKKSNEKEIILLIILNILIPWTCKRCVVFPWAKCCIFPSMPMGICCCTWAFFLFCFGAYGFFKLTFEWLSMCARSFFRLDASTFLKYQPFFPLHSCYGQCLLVAAPEAVFIVLSFFDVISLQWQILRFFLVMMNGCFKWSNRSCAYNS